MEILEEGKDSGEQLYRGRCSCGCYIQCKKSELSHESGHPIGDPRESGGFYYKKCPMKFCASKILMIEYNGDNK